jgi:hypothetical protein
MKEYRDLTADPIQDMITAGPVSEDNMLEWEALIQGPEGTPYVSTAHILGAARRGYWPVMCTGTGRCHAVVSGAAASALSGPWTFDAIREYR